MAERALSGDHQNHRVQGRRRQQRAGRWEAIRARLTFANVVALLALVMAVGGGSIALATVGRQDRKIIKRIVNTEVSRRAPGLSVAHADSAAGAGEAAHANEAAHAVAADQAAEADHAVRADTADDADYAVEADHATSADRLSCEPPIPGTGEMVRVGSFCIDRYEASIWSRPDGGTQLTTEGQIDGACPNNGQPQGSADCVNFYARSVPGVKPAENLTWFQAQQALANSGRRMPQNAEWQEAVSGTPDSAQCVVVSPTVELTGSSPTCVSRFGAQDMVGNVNEWVADWVTAPTACPSWGAISDDLMCISGASTTVQGPAAMFRGGYNGDASRAGPLAVAGLAPQNSSLALGFRGAR